jgi:SagB-type dehydrogenase family enzyme
MKDYDKIISERRDLLKAHDYDKFPYAEWWKPDQQKGINPPPLEKPFDERDTLIELIPPEKFNLNWINIYDTITRRKSRRVFIDDPLTLEEISFLLWATQGVREIDNNKVWTKRATPSGGGRQPFETYLLVNRIEGLERGVYRYLPIEHKLLIVSTSLPDADTLMENAWYQNFIGKAPVVFVWSAIPNKTEWRYSIMSYKDILIEAGHICQNLYLACETINTGTCAIAAYNQKVLDELIQVDGVEEMTVYISPVGKVNETEVV